jgi:two-component system response regulator FixJ
VDDNTMVRDALARLLRAHGMDARSYMSAKAFLDALPAGSPRCLIVDVNMPDATGIDLQRELARLGVRVPTIVLTGSDDRRYREECSDLGARAFLLKPVDAYALIDAVNAALADGARPDRIDAPTAEREHPQPSSRERSPRRAARFR